MSLDRELRDVLAERAAGSVVPAPDLRALLAGGLRRRQRRRRALVALATCVAIGTVAAGLALALGQRDTRGAIDPVDRPSLSWAESTRVPWCVDGFLIAGAGPPVDTPAGCRFHGPGGRSTRLWHHGGSTVLTSPHGTYRVADGRLTPMSTGGGGTVAISHDGRYVAWQSNHPTNCGSIALQVYEVATAEEVATTRVPGASCSHVQGIDDRGRVYLTVGDETPRDLEVQMYDTGSDSWTRVVGLPAGADSFSITYLTADGFAVATEEQVVDGNPLPLASVEGVVDDQGRFVRQRAVPVGRGLWSPDRSLVIQQRPEGIVVRPAADLTTPVVLDLPEVFEFGATPTDLPSVNMLWESSRSVLVNGESPPAGRPVYRCDVGTGDCSVVDHPGEPALGLSTQAGG